MSGFDQQHVFTSNPREEDNWMETDENGIGELEVGKCKKSFIDFLRNYQEANFFYKYRDTLKSNYNTGQYFLTVHLEDISRVDDELVAKLSTYPNDYIPIFEDAASELADELTSPRPEGQEQVARIQITLTSTLTSCSIRALKSGRVSHLVKVSGIILASTGVRSKAVQMSLMCRGCRSVIPHVKVSPGLEGYSLPRKCTTNQGNQAGDLKCPLDPYIIMPDRCECVDFQSLKFQESPEDVPSGEMPRHLQLYCDRYLCEKAVPGNRVNILGIYSIKKVSQPTKKSSQSRSSVGVRLPYLRVLGIEMELDGSGRSGKLAYTAAEEEEFRKLAASADCYERIAHSIAPSIYGSEDIKKAIACLLFAGSRKRLPDGLTRRGDINVLLLGDPGTAKSQLLKFVEKVSPIAIYTSGKGSSAAGLTASVNRDPVTRNFIMEGGAMVLADGGVVCIDEFDKMREDDRVAIHEAMEQQTISIAKAGITTTLNSRCAVLAAANSIFGRWDETKGDENIDFLPTILSRFDTIFIVKDEHNEERDTTLARHVMRVHMNADRDDEGQQGEGELSLLFLKKYIAYCRSHCGPRLSVEAAEKLKNKYVLMRSGTHDQEIEADKKNPIPITVRQLEAIVRLAEALAKMQLKAFATESHIDEALRLFQVSTLAAASSGSLAGVEGFSTAEDHELLTRIEKQIRRRLAIGGQTSEHQLIQDFTVRQKYPERAVYKVILTMIRRGELQHRMQRKVLYRLK